MMRTCPQQYLPPRFPLFLLPDVSVAPSHCLRRRSPYPFTITASANEKGEILRRHNAKSTALLLNHLSPQTLDGNAGEKCQSGQEEGGTLPVEERVRISEMSLVTKRNPKFPGSSWPGYDAGDSSPQHLRRLFCGENDEVALMRALEIRRGVTGEIFKDAMRRGKFGATFFTNLLSHMQGFIDYVMIEAASLKQSPEFSNAPYNYRAKAVINNSNVVPLIRWLKHNQVSYTKTAKLINLCNGNLEAIRCLVEWLKSNHVKGRFIGVSLMKAGDDILNRSIEDLDEIVCYLESEGVERDWMGYVISRCPKLLTYTIEEVKTRVSFYFNMGMNRRDFGTMVYDYPKALGQLSLEEMKQKVNYISEFGLLEKDICRLLAYKPQLMGSSIDVRWKPLIKYFYYLGINVDGMKRILCKKPVVFCIDMETNIVPKVRFLLEIGVREDAIGHMLVKFPSIMTYNIHTKMRRVVIFLITEVGVSRVNVAKVLASEPQLLGSSIQNKLDASVKYFLSLGIRVRYLGRMVTDFPRLLRYNVERLHPKYRYLRRVMVRPLTDLIKFPRFFSYSLEERIIPRHKTLVDNHINFELEHMLACTDEEFSRRLLSAIESHAAFESMDTTNHDVREKD